MDRYYTSHTFAPAGVDEAGRGPLAGPVTAASVVFPPGYENSGIADSKKLTARKREVIFGEIVKDAYAYSIISVGPRRIEILNIREATRLAMKLAAERLQRAVSGNGYSLPLRFLVDGNVPMATSLPQETIIKGDQSVMVIAAASILAKVTRDRLMQRLEERYPGYGFSKHKGYPTLQHCHCIQEKGPSRVHRRTFARVREYL